MAADDVVVNDMNQAGLDGLVSEIEALGRRSTAYVAGQAQTADLTRSPPSRN